MSTADAEAYLAEPLLTSPGQPLRVAVYSRISRGIRAGVLRTGTLLPRETEIGTALGVSRTVVREALMLLEEDGLIVTRRGIGRFVADSLPPEQGGLLPLEHLFARDGVDAQVRRLELSAQGATDFVTDLIGLVPDSEMWFRECVVVDGDRPMALVQEYLPGDAGLRRVDPGLAREFAAAADDDATLLASLTRRAGVEFESLGCQVAATLAGQTRARHLDIEPGDPLLVLTQTAAVGGDPVYVSKCALPASFGHLVVDGWSLTRLR